MTKQLFILMFMGAWLHGHLSAPFKLPYFEVARSCDFKHLFWATHKIFKQSVHQPNILGEGSRHSIDITVSHEKILGNRCYFTK